MQLVDRPLQHEASVEAFGWALLKKHLLSYELEKFKQIKMFSSSHYRSHMQVFVPIPSFWTDWANTARS
jgi:hypothetical protein